MPIKIVTVKSFQCPICEHLHKTKDLAELCHEECKEHEEEQKTLLQLEDKRKEFAASLHEKEMLICKEADSVEDIKLLFVKYSKEHHGIDLKFEVFDFHFDPAMSNSHSCPIGGVTNWGVKKEGDNTPSSYPGFKGMISFTVTKNGKKFESGANIFDTSRSMKHDAIRAFPEKLDKKMSSSFSSDLPFHFHGIKTGSGGGGTSYRYDAMIWLDDFPKIKARHDEFMKLKAVSDQIELEVQAVKNKFKQKEEAKIQESEKVNNLAAMIETLQESLKNAKLKHIREQDLVRVTFNDERFEAVDNIEKKSGLDRTRFTTLLSEFPQKNKYR